MGMECSECEWMNGWFGMKDHDIFENKAAAPRGS